MNSLEVLRMKLRSTMARYGRLPSPARAGDVAACLERLVLHPDFHADLHERCLCKRMLTYWRLLADDLPEIGAAGRCHAAPAARGSSGG